MENLHLEDLDNESLVDILNILEGMDDALQGEDEVVEND